MPMKSMETVMPIAGVLVEESLLKTFGGLAVVRQGARRPARGVHAGVQEQGGGQDHKVDDAGAGRDADREGLDEGADAGANSVPLHDAEDDRERADVEERDAPREGADRLGEGLLRVLGLARRDADELDGEVGEP